MELKESKEIFYSFSEQSFVGIYLIQDENFVYVNPKFAEIFGYTVEECIDNMHFQELVHPEDLAFVKEQVRKREDGEIQFTQYEFRGIKKNKDIIHVAIYGSSILYKGRAAATGTMLDITQAKQVQEEKITAQKIAGEHEKMALVGQMAGKIAHDFNNMLAIIMGNIELVLMDCKDDATKKTLEFIYKETRKGRNLTKNLVAFARDQEPRQQFFRINEKIDLVINLLKKDLKKIELIRENMPGVPELFADPGMIEHALINLLQNSIHATSNVEHPKITIKTYFINNTICFEIKDNGCGIPEEQLKNIFIPSFTLKGDKDKTGSYKTGIKGAGYGISNVKKYIEQHNGDISVKSVFGSGTEVMVSLPVFKK